jgi:hypothetical protein
LLARLLLATTLLLATLARLSGLLARLLLAATLLLTALAGLRVVLLLLVLVRVLILLVHYKLLGVSRRPKSTCRGANSFLGELLCVSAQRTAAN